MVQQPISQVFEDGDCEGYVMMALDPGIKVCLTSDNVQWVVDEPTRDSIETQEAACIKGEEPAGKSVEGQQRQNNVSGQEW